MSECIHVSKLTVAMKSPTATDFDTSIFSIASVAENVSYTADQLDEKRENRRVYDYMCRLLEVRNWLVECLQTTDIPEVTDLEANLSNGVLLARLANFFEPEIVPASKIFDINQQIYNKDGQLSYRHTDNIMLWRRAVQAVRFPEVFMPETVDIYKGRNVKTIFCLYALAIHLFRLRRAPPIRNQAFNVSFSPSAMEKMRQRLKDSAIPAFSDVGEALAVNPQHTSYQSVTIIGFESLLNDKALKSFLFIYSLIFFHQLLAFLKNPNNSLLYVNDELIDDYQKSLLALKESQIDSVNLSVDQIQKVVNSVNENKALLSLDELLKGNNEIDLSQLTSLLYELQQEDLLEHAKLFYAQLLYSARQARNAPLGVPEIQEIIQSINICIRIKFCVLDDDSERLYELLEHSIVAENSDLKEELKLEYLFLLKQEYLNQSEDHLLEIDQVKAIVQQARNPADLRSQKLRYACEKKDREMLCEVINDVDGYEERYSPAYLMAIQKLINPTSEQVTATVHNVNSDLERVLFDAREILNFNKTLWEKEHETATKKLANTWKSIVRNDSTARYLLQLEEELTRRKRHFEKIIINENKKEDEEKERQQEAELQKKREESAIKIQRWLKMNRSRRDFKELKRSPNPSLRVIRKFIPTLVNSKDDVEKEAEIAESKSRVTKLMGMNNRLKDEIQNLDGKIALLVKNRMNLEEIIEHRDKVMKAVADENLMKKPSFRRKDRDQWNGFEMVIYHLQRQPEFLTALILKYRDQYKVVLDLLKRSVLPMFNFAFEESEEFLFASLIRHIIKTEMSVIEKPEGLKKTFSVSLMHIVMSLLTDRNVVNPKISELKRQLDEKENGIDSFNLDVNDIFESVVGRKPESKEEIANNEKVRETLEQSKQYLSKWSLKFAATIFSQETRMPKILHFLISAVSKDLKEKFPLASEREITRAVAGWIYKSCFEGQVVDVMSTMNETTKNVESHDRQKAISKMIEYGASNIGYGEDKWHLWSLNETISQMNALIMNFFLRLLNEKTDYESVESSDFWNKRQPSLHISLPHLNVLHRNLKENVNSVGVVPFAFEFNVLTNPNDTVRAVSFSLGRIFTSKDQQLQKLVERTPTPSADQEVYITLFLHPMPSETGCTQEEELQKLFERTKKQIVECLLCNCRGNDIICLLNYETSEEQENAFSELPHPEDQQITLDEQMQQIRTNLAILEKAELVNKNDAYQAIVTAIAKDINKEQEYRKEREEQLERLRTTVTKLEEQKKDYCNRLDAYREYLEKCLENLSFTMRRPSIRPDSEKASKILAQRQSLDKVQKSRCSAEKLDKKGILQSVDGCEKTKQYKETLKKLTIEITTTEKPGILSLAVSEPKKPVIRCEINFQDLLQAKDRDEVIIKVAGKLNFHVPKFIEFLNTKFYAK